MSGDVEVSELTKAALEACWAWHVAESKGLGSFDARMELCNYSEWCVRRALASVYGQPFNEPYQGVPHLMIDVGPLDCHLARANEEIAAKLVKEVKDHESAPAGAP